MSKKDKSKKVDKATDSAKKAQKAVKEGKAKLVTEETYVAPVEPIRISEFAVKNERPQDGALLDELRAADLAAGMNEKSARVQRAGRVRLLNAGKTLPDHGGLMELNGAGALEVELTTAPPLPEGMAPLPVEDNPAAQQQVADPAEDELRARENPANESKKERKARLKAEAEAAELLAAEQFAAEARAEIDRANAELAARTGTEAPALSKKEAKRAAKQLAKEQAAAAAFVPKAKPIEEPVPELPKTPAAKPAPVRNDALLTALTEAQGQANKTGKKQPVTGPRQYVNKNYGVRLQEKYIGQFPGLEVKDDTFDEVTQKFVNHFVVVPQS